MSDAPDLDQALDLWFERRLDTYEIAAIIGVPEYQIANGLAQIFDRAYREMESENSAPGTR